jgi:F420-non-reducing hydrogenase iron-sulfur subunit
VSAEDDDWASALEARLEAITAWRKPSPFEPRILALVCNWCAYAGADKAGAAQLECPPNVRLVRVMCSGRVDAQHVLMAFDRGADGVLVLACHPGDCHYKEQNLRAVQRHRILQQLLRQSGIGAERCRLDFVSAAEGEKFVRVAREMVDDVKRLGPLRRRGGPQEEECR